MSARHHAASNSGRVPVVNTALKVKSRKLRGKLKDVIATQLRQDMERLLNEETFADLSLVIGSESKPVHSRLILSRLDIFYSRLIEPLMTETEAGEGHTADLSRLGVTMTDLKNLLRAIYTEDNVRPFWTAFQDSMKSPDPAEPMECQTTAIENNNPEEVKGNIDEISQPDEEPVLADGAKSQEPHATAQVNGVTIWDQTSPIPTEAHEYATLGSVKPAVGYEPGTTTSLPRTSHQEGINPSNQASKKTVTPKEKARTINTSTESGGLPVHSTVGVTTLPSVICPLGKDLLAMFDGNSSADHDIIIKVDGKEIPAHRFFLCARSEYFSAMLGGGFRETLSSEIELQGVSYPALMIALQLIYGGVSELPDGMVLKDVLCLANMYCMETLKEVVESKLRIDYCHCFHKV